MEELDTSLFADIADALGISSPAIVEKDYWVVQLLKLLNGIQIEGFDLVFAGGTCLSKAHIDTYRMSEDLDINLVPHPDTSNLSRTAKKEARKKAHLEIKSVLSASKTFDVKSEPDVRNEYIYQHFLLKYPKTQEKISALREEVQLDIRDTALLEESITCPISSFYSSSRNLKPEIELQACASLYSIAAEKVVSLLRRTVFHHRNSAQKDDETLVRHVYDLHLIAKDIGDVSELKPLVESVIQIDRQQFGNQDEKFNEDPVGEMKFAEMILRKQKKFRERYDRFIGPLVYHPAPAKWDEAIETIGNLVKTVLD